MSFAWALFLLYLAGTGWLGWRGYRRTSGFGSYAVGDRNMHPLIVGITLAASVSSAATFIINPGFVYVDGFSAFFHMVVGVGIGFIVMLSVLSFRFRRIGAENQALTIPDWIGKRYKSAGFSLYFAFISLLAFAFVVLLVGGISIVMQSLLGVSNVVALVITLVFVTGYVFIGGTYAHVLTNMLQGSLMILVTIVVLASCIWIAMQQPVSILEGLRSIDPGLIAPVNTASKLFNDTFSIYVAGFVVGAVIVCQPHILTKALYVKDDRNVKRYIGVFTVVFFLFQLLGAVGFFAHFAVPDAALVDATSGQFRQDLVMTMYLKSVFPEWVFTIISVVLLAAAMSTLDGLLVSLSTIAANDLVLNLQAKGDQRSEEQRMAFALRASHVVLLVIAVAAFLINLQPPRLLGIFGQTGVYGMAVASAPPLLLGVLFTAPRLILAWCSSALAFLLYVVLVFFGDSLFSGATMIFANPGVSAAMASLLVIPAVLALAAILDKRTA